MLQKLKDIFSNEKAPTLAELLSTKRELEEEHTAATVRHSQVSREATDAIILAMASGDDKERAKQRRRIADGDAELREIAVTIDRLDDRIEAAQELEAGNRLTMDRAERARLAEERQNAAALLQRHLADFCAAYYAFYDIGRRIEAKLGTRTIRNKMQDRDFYLRAEIEQQLICRSPESLLGDRSMLGGFTVGEFMRDGRLLDLQEHVRRQNARLLSDLEPMPKAA